MNEPQGYAVYFFPQAIEALGEAIKPFLLDGPAGLHIACVEIDTGGAFVEMTLQGTTREGKPMAVELMVPSGMVRMIVSTQSEGVFGFGLRQAPPAAPTGPDQVGAGSPSPGSAGDESP